MFYISSSLDSRMKKRNAVTGDGAIFEHSIALEKTVWKLHLCKVFGLKETTSAAWCLVWWWHILINWLGSDVGENAFGVFEPDGRCVVLHLQRSNVNMYKAGHHIGGLLFTSTALICTGLADIVISRTLLLWAIICRKRSRRRAKFIFKLTSQLMFQLTSFVRTSISMCRKIGHISSPFNRSQWTCDP